MACDYFDDTAGKLVAQFQTFSVKVCFCNVA